MKRLSFQWRITLLTALLIAASCIVLNLLVSHSGAYYFDTLGKYVVEYSGTGSATDDDGDVVIIDMSPEKFDAFYTDFTRELIQAKADFGARSWAITAVVTLLSGAAAYFVSGRSLRPLRDFSRQIGQVQAKHLTEIRLSEDTVPEFRTLSLSINRMLVRLSAAFEAQRQFSGNAAHELRTPLALMQARLDLYRREHGGETGEGAETIALLAEQTERLSHLVRTLLSLSELETIPRTDRIELAPLIEEVLTDLTPLAEKGGISLEQAEGDGVLTGSDVLLYRLLFNLVENAIKYNRPGGRVTVSVAGGDGNVLLRVSDTGAGIPERFRESVFQPFFRIDKARSRSLCGVGLGLSLVWEIAQLHGGSVRIEEGTDAGTTFAVTLPAGTDLIRQY